MNKIQGIGDLKFGRKLEDFDKSGLQPLRFDPHRPSAPEQSFLDTNIDTLSWGTLHPTRVELTFDYGELVGIAMRFEDTNATLMAVMRAVVAKYGLTNNSAQIQFADSSSQFGSNWATNQIYMIVSAPELPQSVDDDFLTKKGSAAVQIFNTALQDKLTKDKHDAAEKALIKNNDLQKIEADL